MRVLVVDRYYWPDTAPHSKHLRKIAHWLVDAGHDVFVFSGQPSYKPELDPQRAPCTETDEGVSIRRVSLLRERKRNLVRYLNHLYFVLCGFFHILTSRHYDVVVSQSSPPVIQAFAIALAAKIRGTAFVYNIHDIYPEIVHSMGLVKQGILYRICAALDTFSIRSAATVVTLSDDMVHVLRNRSGHGVRIEKINNFADFGFATETDQSSTKRPARFVFAGNMGPVQGLENIVQAFSHVPADVASLELLGAGSRRKHLERQVSELGLTNVTFWDHLSEDEAFARIGTFDFGVITLRSDVIRYSFPSKMATYSAANLRLLAVVDGDSELVRMVNGLNLGEAVNPHAPPQEIAETVKTLATNKNRYASPVHAARTYFHEEWAKGRWLALFGSIELAGNRYPATNTQVNLASKTNALARNL